MNNRYLAEKIFKELNEKGAGLGNASINIIEKTINNNLKTSVMKTIKLLAVLLLVGIFTSCEDKIQDNCYRVTEVVNDSEHFSTMKMQSLTSNEVFYWIVTDGFAEAKLSTVICQDSFKDMNVKQEL